MKKVLTIAALLALLAVPMVVLSVGANDTCPDGGDWTKIDSDDLSSYPVDGAVEYCFKAGPFLTGSIPDGGFGQSCPQDVDEPEEGPQCHRLSHWSYRLGDSPPEITTRVTCAGWRVFYDGEKVDEGFWTLPFEQETAASTFYDALIHEPRNCVTPVPTATPEPITLENSCAGWRLKQGGETIDGAAWEDPYSLETAASKYVDYLIREPKECLKERGDATLRIGGRCTEDGDSQEIGYVFDDGDFDGARLIITRADGVEVANEGEGSGFFPARAAVYGWKIVWSDGQNRHQLDAGRFEVTKCDLPDPTPTPPPGDCSNTGDNICPDDPPEHPPTGGEINALPVVVGLLGYALVGIGGSILFVKRRASS